VNLADKIPVKVSIVEGAASCLNQCASLVNGDNDFLFGKHAANGKEAKALVDNHEADVYLVELELPDMSGIEVIKYARHIQPECQIMVFTDSSDEMNIFGSIHAGATGYLLKDSSPKEIIAALRALVQGGSPISPSIARKIFQKISLDNLTREPAKTDVPPLPPGPVASSLTVREVQILKLLSKGLSFEDISDSLEISTHTVARHIKNTYRKLSVKSRAEAVFQANKLGIIQV
jgi:DNA-binding NarL/FixJ family response regulator